MMLKKAEASSCPTPLRMQGMSDEAELRAEVVSRRETLGNKHPDTLRSISDMARLLQDNGKLAEAKPLCHEVLAGYRETLGDKHHHTLRSSTAWPCC